MCWLVGYLTYISPYHSGSTCGSGRGCDGGFLISGGMKKWWHHRLSATASVQLNRQTRGIPRSISDYAPLPTEHRPSRVNPGMFNPGVGDSVHAVLHFCVRTEESDVGSHLYGPSRALPTRRVDALYSVDDAEEETSLDRCESVAAAFLLRLPESGCFREELVSWVPSGLPVLLAVLGVARGVLGRTERRSVRDTNRTKGGE